MARTYRTYLFGRDVLHPARDPVSSFPALERVPPCPMCSGRMEVVYDKYSTTVAVCVDCLTGVTVPRAAGDVVRLKREGKWEQK